MKLRIRGNSVRIRVSQSELAQLAESGAAEDAVRFSPESELRYRVEVRPKGAVQAEFGATVLRVLVPKKEVDRWLEPEQVAIQGSQAVGGGERLRILLEKDYTCLAPRGDEDDSDLFRNPQKSGKARA